jgi:hypothetical protein
MNIIANLIVNGIKHSLTPMARKKAEFLALMKLSQPQRKLAMTPFTEAAR